MLIQLPNDVVTIGYKQTKPFKYEQVFHSASNSFTGTENEFIIAGIAYGYTMVCEHSRRVLL
jgi:hypothetical protein